jgi:hypothetical protein
MSVDVRITTVYEYRILILEIMKFRGSVGSFIGGFVLIFLSRTYE